MRQCTSFQGNLQTQFKDAFHVTYLHHCAVQYHFFISSAADILECFGLIFCYSHDLGGFFKGSVCPNTASMVQFTLCARAWD